MFNELRILLLRRSNAGLQTPVVEAEACDVKQRQRYQAHEREIMSDERDGNCGHNHEYVVKTP